jgi:hypothetical protein
MVELAGNQVQSHTIEKPVENQQLKNTLQSPTT